MVGRRSLRELVPPYKSLEASMPKKLALPFACILLLASGCGSNLPATIAVHGIVTYGGGPWPTAGEIIFLPTKAAPGFPLRPGKATFDVDGRFVAGTFSTTDGLMPGSYLVNIKCWKVPPSMGGPPPVSYLPEAYRTPHWTIDIDPGSRPLDLAYDVPHEK